MTYFDEELRTLQLQAARRPQLETKLNALCARQTELERKVRDLDYVARIEQNDVDELEGRSLAALFYLLIGQKDEKLDKEKAEAYAAKVRYDAAAQELTALQQDIHSCREELHALSSAQQRYTQLLAEKEAAIKASGSPAAAQILELEQQLGSCKAMQRELQEAISAGRGALRTAAAVLEHLDSANSLATWDMLGGGTLADLAKHDRLDQAQREVEYLQVQLSRFRSELADVTIRANLQIRIEGFDRFADYFFDGLFADWNVKEKIEQARQQASGTRYEIEAVLKKLDGMLSAEKQRHTRLQAQRELLITEATV